MESPNQPDKRRSLRRINWFVIVFASLSVLVLLLPVQHWMPLSRHQKLGLAVFVFGLGYINQLAFSARYMSKWLRACHLATGLFCISVFFVFWTNPWLDYAMSAQNDEQDHLRGLLFLGYLLISLTIAGMWAKGLWEDLKTKAKEPPKGG